MVKLLVSKGADVSCQDRNGQTPLHEVAFGGWLETAKVLVSKGAKLNTKDKGGKTPLGMAIGREQTGLAEFLRQKGATE